MEDVRWTFFPPLPRNEVKRNRTGLNWSQVERLATKISDQLECHGVPADETPLFERLAKVELDAEELEVADEKTLDFVYLCHALSRLSRYRVELIDAGVDLKVIDGLIGSAADTQLFLDKFYSADLEGVLAIGNRRVASTRKTGLSNRKSKLKQQQEHNEAVKALDAISRRCPGWSKTARMKAAAENLGISLSTIKRRLRPLI